jgi:hypothetical protein
VVAVMLEYVLGYIRPLSIILSLSLSLSLSTIVLVKKKNGEFRFTIDYRKLNAVTQQITYTLQNLNDIFDATGN